MHLQLRGDSCPIRNFAVRKTFEATTSLFLRNTIIDKVNEKGLRVDVETSAFGSSYFSWC